VDLILWRHAEAVECVESISSVALDMERVLTAKGEKQAARMGAWLDRLLPEGARILVSPAKRCEQTAFALGRKYKIRPELGPQETSAKMLELIQWPHGKTPVLVIGHQPILGQVLAQLLEFGESECAVKKGSVWWIRNRSRGGEDKTVLVCMQSPETL
jgi:phosphohistidine phosphatase